MKPIRLLVLAAIVAGMFVVIAGPASADVATCQQKISDLRTATANATFFGKNAAKEKTGLLGKLDAASSALAAGKNADAIQKLTDFRDHVAQLEGQGKVAPADADALIAGANDAIACIQAEE